MLEKNYLKFLCARSMKKSFSLYIINFYIYIYTINVTVQKVRHNIVRTKNLIRNINLRLVEIINKP